MLSVAMRQRMLPSLDHCSPFISLLWDWCQWVGLYVSQLQVSLDGIVEPETRAPSLSMTRRQLTAENLLWWPLWWHPHGVSSPPEILSDQHIFHRWQPYRWSNSLFVTLSPVHCPRFGSVYEGGQHDCTVYHAFNPHGHMVVVPVLMA